MPKAKTVQGHSEFKDKAEKKRIYEYCRAQGSNFTRFTRLLYLSAMENGWAIQIVQDRQARP